VSLGARLTAIPSELVTVADNFSLNASHRQRHLTREQARFKVRLSLEGAHFRLDAQP
jgi:hypothetical protein